MTMSTQWLKCSLISYVHWTVHHLDSWIKRNQLDVTCFFISVYIYIYIYLYIYLISIPTDAHTYKFHIKALKLLWHVSTLRSSSESHTFLAKVTIKISHWLISLYKQGANPVLHCVISRRKAQDTHPQSVTLNNITLHNKTCCHNTLFIQRN